MKRQNIQTFTCVIAMSFLLLAACQKDSFIDDPSGRLLYEAGTEAAIDNVTPTVEKYEDDDEAPATRFIIYTSITVEGELKYARPVEPEDVESAEELLYESIAAGFTLAGEGEANTRFIGTCAVGIDISYHAESKEIEGSLVVYSEEDGSSVTFRISDSDGVRRVDGSLELQFRLETVETTGEYRKIMRWGNASLRGLEDVFTTEEKSEELELTINGFYRL